MRRTLIIGAMVVVLAGAGAAIYFYFFAGEATSITATPGGTNLPLVGQDTLPSKTSPEVAAPPATPSVPEAVSPRLAKISAGPVVPGEIVLNVKAKNASSSPDTTVSYIERQSGNIYSYSTLSKTVTRTSNKTIPGIQSASWLPSGALAFVRYLSGADFSTINTYALPASGTGGFFLPQNITGLAVSSTSVLALASGVNGSVVSAMRPDGTRSSSLFTTPLSSVRISFAGKNRYLAYTKPSASIAGSAFLVDGSGHFTRLAGPLAGLVALASPLGKWVLLSYVLGDTVRMSLVNASTGVSVSLPVATVADKCVWADNDSAVYCGIPVSPPAGKYPDDWYQGAVHFSDRIWKIDTAGRYAQLVLDFNKEADTVLDATALSLDPLGTTLVFLNKNDGSLWAYSL